MTEITINNRTSRKCRDDCPDYMRLNSDFFNRAKKYRARIDELTSAIRDALDFIDEDSLVTTAQAIVILEKVIGEHEQRTRARRDKKP